MTSRTLLNLILALSLAGLIALAIYEPGKPDSPAAKTLTQLDANHIQRIRIQSAGHADIELKKIADRWQMLTPFAVTANQPRIGQLLPILTAKSLAIYNLDQVDTTQLQLDTPLLTLIFNDTRFDLGGTAPLGDSRYVRINDAVHLFTDRYSHLARGPATDLVSPTLLHSDDTIVALHLPTLELALRDGKWQIEKPDTAHTPNPDQLQQLLAEWRHARAFTVQPLTSNSQATESIEVTTSTSSLNFSLLRSEDEIILQRHDLGLQYHFSIEAGQRLLALPTTTDA